MAYSKSFTNGEIRNRIRNIWSNFVVGVEPDRLSDWLVQEYVITPEQWQKIRNDNPTKQSRCRELLHHLFSIPHPRAFLVVYRALAEENHYLLESIDNQEPGSGTGSQHDIQTVLQGKEKTEQPEKNCEDNKRVWEAEKDRLLRMQKAHEDQKRAWKEEKDRLLKMQKVLETKLHSNGSEQQKLEQERKVWRKEKEQLFKQNQDLQHSLVKLRYKSNIVLVQTIVTKATKEEKTPINGLAILDKEVFVVNLLGSDVEVYDSKKFSFSRRWNLKENFRPGDMESCKRNKCLYINDYEGDGLSYEIVRVDPNGKLIKNWSTGNDCGYGLSVTNESNVILSIFDKNKLNEYSPDGQLIREINLSLDADIHHPRHAIKLSNGHFVVSHGSVGDALHGVCIVDADGNVKKSFGGKPGSDIGQLNVPINLSVDGNGFVLVADGYNNRVLLLDPDLKFKREILSKANRVLRYPGIALLDESNGRLIVADNECDSTKQIISDGRVLIFSLSD